MSRIIFFFLFFVVLSSNVFGKKTYMEDEVRRQWEDAGFNMNFFLERMSADCQISERFFSGCMMALHELISNDTDKDNFLQLRVSGSNELEIVPYFNRDEDLKSLDSFSASENKRRESFRAFFRLQTNGRQIDESNPIKGILDDILQQSMTLFGNHIPEEDQIYFLSRTYNVFLSEAIGSHTSVRPLTIHHGPRSKKLAGIGVRVTSYKPKKTGTIGLGLLIDRSLKGLPAWNAGLRRGDIILAVDDVSLQGKPAKEMEKIKGPEKSRVKLTVQSFCDGEKKDVWVTRQQITVPSGWIEESRVVNIDQQESPGCPDDDATDDGKSPQALYVRLKSFHTSQGEHPSEGCNEFVTLQKEDLGNPRSLGMIIDLRGNRGGTLYTVMCMLNTIIHGTDVLVKKMPVESGEVVDEKSTSFYFTNGSSIIATLSSGLKVPVSYNKHIIVLVDRFSASGSEIFAGTIQNKKRGWVVGDRTGGKGSVQSFFNFPPENLHEFAQSPSQDSEKLNTPLVIKKTVAVYTLGNGKSPQGYGIIPDFRFSRRGEPIEMEDPSEYISIERLFFSNSIGFENNQNNQWEQNRPDEVAELNTCIHLDGKMGSVFKQKRAKNEKRYTQPLMMDYQLELAKDILSCSPDVDDFILHQRAVNIYKHPFG